MTGRAKRARAANKSKYRAGRIAIVGRANVGKSTLLNALLGERIAITSKHPQTTRDRIAGVLTEADAQFVFLDTPGIHEPRTKLGARMNEMSREAAHDCDVILFMTAVAKSPTPSATPSDADLAILKALPSGVPVICVINKVDRIKDKTALFPVLEGHDKAHLFAAIVPISAMKSNGTKPLLDEVKKLLPVGEKLFEADELSDKPMRFFVAEFVREQILQKTFDEVPHGVAVTVEEFDEGPRVPRIALVVHVDKESHKPIVIGKGGSLIKAIGTDARKRVEALLGRQVHLEIRVRVTPQWYESDEKLEAMGYGR